MQKFINELVMVGLTENEAKTYVLLLKQPLTATRIAQTIKVNRSNVYGIIASLVQKGYVREVNGKVRIVMAINPKIAFNTSKTTLQMRIKLMDKLSKDLFPYFESMGEEVGVAKSLPMKLFIFDNKIAVFTLENKLSTISNFTFTSFEHTDVAQTFTQIFKQYWDNAIPLNKFITKVKKGVAK